MFKVDTHLQGTAEDQQTDQALEESNQQEERIQSEERRQSSVSNMDNVCINRCCKFEAFIGFGFG